MEHSLNRGEHRDQIKAKYFRKYGTECRSLWSDVRVTKGRVENENNSQSQYSNMSNTYMSESLIYRVWRHSQKSGISEVQEGTQQCDVYMNGKHRITQDQNMGICTGSGNDKICKNTIL